MLYISWQYNKLKQIIMKNVNLVVFILLLISAIFFLKLNVNAQCVKIAYVKVLKSDVKNSILFEKDETNKSFVEYIVEASLNNKITAYSYGYLNLGDEFEKENKYGTRVLTNSDILKNLGQKVDSFPVLDSDGAVINTKTKITPYNIQEIIDYIFIEKRTYNKKGKLTNTKIIGIIPVRHYPSDDEDEEVLRKKAILITYFPDLEPIINKTKFYKFLIKSKYKSNVIINESGGVVSPEDSSNIMEYDIYPEYCPKFSLTELVAEDAEYNPYPPINLQGVKYVKYTEERIWMDSVENIPLFYPLDSTLFGNVSMANLMLDAVFTGKVKAYSSDYFDSNTNVIIPDSSIRIALGERIYEQYVEDENEGAKLIYVKSEYNPNEITSYLLNVLHFYDYDNNLIKKQIIGIWIIRKFFREEDFDEENPLYRKILWLKFDEIAPILANKKMVKLNCSENRTFLDVFYNQQYNAEIEDRLYGNATEYGIDSVFFQDTYVNINSNYSFLDNLIPTKSKPYIKAENKAFNSSKIVYVTAEKQNDNLPLFGPHYSEHGYKRMIDYAMDGILNKMMPVYKTENFIKLVDTIKIKEILGERIDTMYISNDLGEYDGSIVIVLTNYNSQEITSYKFKELWLYDEKGNVVEKQILAICPIREYLDDLGNLKVENTFWLNYLDYRDYFNQYNITKIEPIADKTFYEYLQTQQYNSKVIEERSISIEKAKLILEKF